MAMNMHKAIACGKKCAAQPRDAVGKFACGGPVKKPKKMAAGGKPCKCGKKNCTC